MNYNKLSSIFRVNKILLFLVFFLPLNELYSQGDECSTSLQLTSLSNYCSAGATFTNVLSTQSPFSNATCWSSSVAKDVWFKFTSIGTDVLFSVNGYGYGANTLKRPNLAIYQGDCSTTINEMSCFSNVSTDNSTVYKGGLIIGTTYILRVTTETAFCGTFDICINNYTPAFEPASDCFGAAYLCDKSPVSVSVLNGSGTIQEGNIPGTCFDIAAESNSSWFKWTCKTSGNLTMDIVGANPSDDIDWILFEMTGGIDDCSTLVSLRCDISSCTNDLGTMTTGMMSTDTDITEPAGCTFPSLYNSYTQDVNLIANHSYALFVNNFSTSSAFTLNWGGTSQFKGPVADFTKDSIVLCNAEQFIFDGSSSSDYTNLNWSFSGLSSPTSAIGPGPHTVDFNFPGTYSIVLTANDASSCSSSKNITVIVPLVGGPEIDEVSTIEPICETKGTITLNLATGGVSPYLYSLNGIDFYTSNVFDSLTGGVYSLVIKDANGCLADSVIYLNPLLNFMKIDLVSIIDPICNIKGIVKVETFEGGIAPYSFTINGVDFYNSNVFNNISAGTYFLSVKDFNGCLADTIIHVNTASLNEVPIIPNCFTPNNDKINDEWYIESDCVEEFNCTILNRWGEIVKTMTTIEDRWNGLYKNDLLSDGVYTYVIDIKFYNSPSSKISGFITLLK